ncbi:hypothetical protein ANTPLA_LOCUS9189 [Anthophora plagiata]
MYGISDEPLVSVCRLDVEIAAMYPERQIVLVKATQRYSIRDRYEFQRGVLWERSGVRCYDVRCESETNNQCSDNIVHKSTCDANTVNK